MHGKGLLLALGAFAKPMSPMSASAQEPEEPEEPKPRRAESARRYDRAPCRGPSDGVDVRPPGPAVQMTIERWRAAGRLTLFASRRLALGAVTRRIAQPNLYDPSDRLRIDDGTVVRELALGPADAEGLAAGAAATGRVALAGNRDARLDVAHHAATQPRRALTVEGSDGVGVRDRRESEERD